MSRARQELDTLHTTAQLIEVALGNLVATVAQLVLNIYMVGNLHRANKVARKTCVGLRDANIESLFDTLLSGSNSLTHLLAIVDMASRNTLHGLRYDATNIDSAIILNRTYGDNDIR